MQQMMQKAQQMQEKLAQEVALIRVEATAGGGMITVKMETKTCYLSKSNPKSRATSKCSRI
jgi:hypothetical protein